LWAVIPAAGRASRLHSVTGGGPKALLEVGGRTLLDWLLLRLAGPVTDVCLVVDDLGGPIARSVGSERHGIRVHFAVQPSPKGVGDAVLRAAERVDAAFLTVMGDVYYDQALGTYIDAWRRSDAEGAVLIQRFPEPPSQPMGLVELEGDLVVGAQKTVFRGRGLSGVCGAAILPERVFEAASALGPSDAAELELEDLIGWLIQERGARFLALPYRGWRRNINTADDLAFVQTELEARRA